jgi:K(+)-stimulated pyrophosphate-energized sodium pump
MNILIKLTCLVGLVIAPILGNHDENPELNVVESPGEVHNDAAYMETVDADGNFIYNTGEVYTINLPNGKKLNVGKFSAEQKLNRFLSDPELANKSSRNGELNWVTLDRVMFKSGSSELISKSVEQIENIVKLLKAYPDAKIKIGGYTDNVGDENTNLKISTERANIVKTALEKMGIDENRMQSEGYGAQHFKCEPNDTEICRAKNRRVDIKVVTK